MNCFQELIQDCQKGKKRFKVINAAWSLNTRYPVSLKQMKIQIQLNQSISEPYGSTAIKKCSDLKLIHSTRKGLKSKI